MQKRIIKFKERNKKPLRQYKRFLKWCGVYIATAVVVGGLGGMFGGITYELVRYAH